MATLSPNNLGCWFCGTDDGYDDFGRKKAALLEPNEPMHFTIEFDAYFHMSCLMSAMKEPNNRESEREAEIIALEFHITRD